MGLGFGCPGPGSKWGDPFVPPASKDAESPSILNIVTLRGEGVPPFSKKTKYLQFFYLKAFLLSLTNFAKVIFQPKW